MKRFLVLAALLGCGKLEDPGSVVRLRVPGRAGAVKVPLKKGAETLLEALSTDDGSEHPAPAPSLPPSLARETAAPTALPVPEKIGALPEMYLRHGNPLVRWWAAEAAGLARRRDLVGELGRMVAARDVVGSMAAWALGVIGESAAVPALAGGMFDRRPELRLSCAAALSLIDGRRASRALASGLAAEDYRVRAVCARELGRRKQGLRRLSRLCRDQHEPAAVRVEAACPLAAKGDEGAFRYLAGLAARGGPAARVLALRALGRTSLAKAVLPAAAALEAREAEVWQEAGIALARLPKDEVTRALEPLEREGFLRATVVLGAIGGERAYDRLKRAYERGDVALRRFVCAALVSCRDARATELLVSASGSDRLSVRLAGIGSLGLRGDARGLGALLRAASDPDPRVRMEAARALAHIPDERAGNALAALARDPSRGVRREALLAFARRTAAGTRGSPPASR